MSVQHQQAISQSVGSARFAPSQSIARTLASRLLGKLECGELIVETPRGNRLVFEGRNPGPQARLTIHSWQIVGRLLAGWDIGFADAYVAGEWSSPNLVALLTLACRNREMADNLKFVRTPRIGVRLNHALNRNTRHGSRRNISAHYDLGNQFYERWLDGSMSYSAGLFSSLDKTLEEAQEAKINRVIDLLDLAGGERVLEIGCGWGGLAERLLQKHDCTVTGITLSDEQLAYGQRRLLTEILAGRCDLRLEDYRDVTGSFDRIVSIEMLEAVGETYWPTYFEKLRDSLRPCGIAVLQVITIDESRFESYRRRPDFIQKYIFPGGMLPTKRIIERETAKAGLCLADKQFFGEGYARTLEQWKVRFLNAWPEIKTLGFDDRFKRMWEYYLAYCQTGFETDSLDVGLYKIARTA